MVIINFDMVSLIEFMVQNTMNFVLGVIMIVFIGFFATSLITTIIEKLGYTIATIISFIKNPLPDRVMKEIQDRLTGDQ